ncbi:MAG TPA: TetR/AcrR family transcriptional regulator [Acidiphilium sp.]
MVQNKRPTDGKRRGRPRAYDPETALRQALDAFWKTGFSGTSLDDIAQATGMNRPSLYAAFGDKHALYLKALDQYWRDSIEAMRDILDRKLPLAETLMLIFDRALDIYFSGDGAPRGCFAVGTAVTEAVEDAEIRATLTASLNRLDGNFDALIRAARARGEIAPDADPASLAILATATVHTLALRARSGVARAELQRLARRAVTVICGREPLDVQPSSG